MDYRKWNVDGEYVEYNYEVKDENDYLIGRIEKRLWNILDTYDILVENVPRIILPETGGSGTSKFSFIGITLLAGVLSLVSTTEFVLKEREN